jgi:hypothetical protein
MPDPGAKKRETKSTGIDAMLVIITPRTASSEPANRVTPAHGVLTGTPRDSRTGSADEARRDAQRLEDRPASGSATVAGKSSSIHRCHAWR